MPSEIYGTLYNQHDLNTVITMVKDIYAKEPKLANPPTTTGGAAAPFTLIKAPNGNSKRVHFQEGKTLSDRIDKLTETLYRIEWIWKGNPPKSPISHTLQVPDVEEEEVALDPGEVTLAMTEVYLSLEESIGIVDLRSLGYYNIKPQVMHFHLTGIHNLFSKWNLDLRFEEHFAKISTQNVCY